MKYFKSHFEFVNEAKLSAIHKAAKKGSYPVSLVVIKDGKVIAQELVKTPAAVPAAFNVIKNYHKHKGATVHVESKTGERLFSESVNEAKFTKKSLMRAMKKDDGMIQLGNGQEYVIYNPNNGNDYNADMWQDKVIFGLDQDGEEHEIEYSDIVRYDESEVTEALYDDDGNDYNADMWQDKVIFGLDQDGEEHEIEYSDIVRYDESEVTEALYDDDGNGNYKYKKYVAKAFKKISDEMFAFRNAMGVKQLSQADPKLQKRLDAMQTEISALQKEMKSQGLSESIINEAFSKKDWDVKWKMPKDNLFNVTKTTDAVNNRYNALQSLLKSKPKELKAFDADENHPAYDMTYDELMKWYNKLDESEVNEATDFNDPVLVAYRATSRDLPKLKIPKLKSRRLSFDKYMDLLDARLDVDQQIKDLRDEMAQTLRDMEQEAEPEGGEVADKYGSTMMKQEKEYTKLMAKKDKIMARIDKHRMA